MRVPEYAASELPLDPPRALVDGRPGTTADQGTPHRHIVPHKETVMTERQRASAISRIKLVAAMARAQTPTESPDTGLDLIDDLGVTVRVRDIEDPRYQGRR
jgi:hypothetical protein